MNTQLGITFCFFLNKQYISERKKRSKRVAINSTQEDPKKKKIDDGTRKLGINPSKLHNGVHIHCNIVGHKISLSKRMNYKLAINGSLSSSLASRMRCSIDPWGCK